MSYYSLSNTMLAPDDFDPEYPICSECLDLDDECPECHPELEEDDTEAA